VGLKLYALTVYLFLYIPIGIIVLFSFNAVSYTHLTLPTICSV